MLATMDVVSTGDKQAIVLAIGGLALVAVVVVLARRRLVTTRYALGWILVAAAVVVAASLTGFVGELGTVAGMTPTAVFLALATVTLVGLALQLSISVSGLQSQLRDVVEALALSEERLREVERNR